MDAFNPDFAPPTSSRFFLRACALFEQTNIPLVFFLQDIASLVYGDNINTSLLNGGRSGSEKIAAALDYPEGVALDPFGGAVYIKPKSDNNSECFVPTK